MRSSPTRTLRKCSAPWTASSCPAGFGARAFEGKIAAARYARENNVPFLGICLGLQAAVCSFARDVCGLEGATSAEFADAAPEGTPLVIDLMPEQEDVEDQGRHHAPRGLSLQSGARAPARRRPTASPSSTSATATATR